MEDNDRDDRAILLARIRTLENALHDLRVGRRILMGLLSELLERDKPSPGEGRSEKRRSRVVQLKTPEMH